MRAPHLLGLDWQAERWFATAGERDALMASYLGQFAYYRQGDRPSLIVVPIDR